nr:hypothetical protein [Nanoarchaeota archaeon]
MEQFLVKKKCKECGKVKEVAVFYNIRIVHSRGSESVRIGENECVECIKKALKSCFE